MTNKRKNSRPIHPSRPIYPPFDKYISPVDTGRPILVVLVLDQSSAMSKLVQKGKVGMWDARSTPVRGMVQLARDINCFFNNQVMRLTGGAGRVKPWIDVAVLGYRTNSLNRTIVESPLKRELSGTRVISIVEIADNIGRIEKMTRQVYDDDTAETYEEEMDVPIWVDPVAEGGRPVCAAFREVQGLVDRWIRAHPVNFPPIVFHLTSGPSMDGDTAPLAAAITDLETEDGNVLLFSCYLSNSLDEGMFFPHAKEMLPDSCARGLFEMSSVLPPLLVEYGRVLGFDLHKGARAMSVNGSVADMFQLFSGLEWGSRLPMWVDLRES